LYLQATGRLAPMQLEVAHKTNVTELSDEELTELLAAGAASEQRFRLETKTVKADNGNN
jgi:hypothetical protein